MATVISYIVGITLAMLFTALALLAIVVGIIGIDMLMNKNEK